MRHETTDMPTVARIRARLSELAAEDITLAQAMWVFGLSSKTAIIARVERGEFSGAKVLGEWRIDAASVERYLDRVNSEYNKEFTRK